MATLTATAYEVLPRGTYKAGVESVEQRESDKGAYLRWTFTITEGPHKNKQVGSNSSLNFGPKAKARRWAEELLFHTFAPGETLNTSALVGVDCELTLDVETKDGNEYNVIAMLAGADIPA